MALINIYNQISNKHEEVRANGKLKDILPDFDFSHSIILRAGERVDADVELAEDDVIYLRVVPGITSTTAAVIAIVCAVVAVGVGIGAAIYANKQSEEAKAQMEKAQRDAENLASQINQLPFLKGAKNTKALGRNIQFLIGEMFNTPYLLTDGFYTLAGTDGDKQFWNAILCLGFGKQKIKSVSIGSVKVKDFEDGTTDDLITTFDEPTGAVGNPYYDDETIIEIAQQKELTTDIFKRKVISTQDGSEIKHDFEEAAEPVIKQCAERTKKLEVAIQFNGLRRYNTSSSSWVARNVEINPYWSNDNGATWHKFYFNFPNQSGWLECDDQSKRELINSGKLQMVGSTGICFLFSKSGDVQVFDLMNQTWDTQSRVSASLSAHRVRVLSDGGSNILSKNTNKTIRYVAEKEFTWSETHDANGNELPIIFKVEKATPKMESNSTEDCYLLYYNCFCYDGKLSNSVSGLVDAKPMSDWYTEKCSFIGVQMVANESTHDVLDEINVVSSGLAKVWDAENEEWSEDKEATRNPASWILELLTSDKHAHSQYSEEEIDMASLGELYEYCEENNFYVDTILTKGDKKNTVISNILSTCFASMYTDAETGLLTFAIDREESSPVALLNSQCIQSLTVAKSFERKPDGIKVNFTNRNNWEIDTRYCMLDGSDSHDVEDLLTELSVDYVTTPEHAYKIAQRKMRMERLQPREVKVKIGKEGDYYPLYSTVLLQLEQMKQGIRSSVIENIGILNNEIIALEIGDWVEFVSGNNYGVIIQCEDENGFQLRNLKVTGSGKTRTLTLINPISLDDEGTLPQFKNILSFGLLDDDGEFTKVTNTMKIYGINGGSDGIELTLKDYNPDVYSYGVIPPYKSNLTNPPTKLNKVSDLEFKGQINEVKKEIEEVKATQYGGSITQLSSLDPTGFTEGALGLYEQKFYRLENGAWVELNSDLYLGKSPSLPSDVGIGSYFLASANIRYDSLLLMTSGGALEIDDGDHAQKVLAVTHLLTEGYLHVKTSNGWKTLTDKNDYRYVVAMNDMASLGYDVPFYVKQAINEIATTTVINKTPHYLGAFSTPPQNANEKDWFTYIGATSGMYTKGTVYYWNGQVWAEDTDSGHQMQALNDLLALTVEAGDGTFASVLCDRLTANKAFLNYLETREILFKNYVASIKNDNDQMISMGTDPNNKDSKDFSFIIQQKMGSGWDKQFWTQRQSDGAISLRATGDIVVNGSIYADFGSIWREQTINDCELIHTVFFSKVLSVWLMSDNHNNIRKSSDGNSWSIVKTLSGDAIHTFIENEHYVYALSINGVVYRTNNGNSWQEISSGINRSWHSWCYYDGKFAALSEDSQTIYYTSDFVSWNSVTAYVFTGGDKNTLTYLGASSSGFVGVTTRMGFHRTKNFSDFLHHPELGMIANGIVFDKDVIYIGYSDYSIGSIEGIFEVSTNSETSAITIIRYTHLSRQYVSAGMLGMRPFLIIRENLSLYSINLVTGEEKLVKDDLSWYGSNTFAFDDKYNIFVSISVGGTTAKLLKSGVISLSERIKRIEDVLISQNLL